MKSIRDFFVLVALTMAIVTAPSQADYYVDQGGNHVYPYTNWTDAARNIQSALDVATNYATVWVAEGIYTATNAVIPDGGTNVVEVLKPLTLRASGSVANTVINGEGTNRCIYVYYSMDAGDPKTFCLDGFTVTNGAAERGGGIFFDTYLSHTGNPYNRMIPDIRNCVITDNVATNGSAGGISWAQYGGYSLTLSNCVVRNNKTLTADGGGLWCATRAPIYIYDSVFEGNTTIGGGTRRGAGAWIDAGGSSAEVVFRNTVFRGNLASDDGGALYGNRLALRMRSCLLVDNEANAGAALYLTDKAHIADLDGCTIVSNRCTTGSGGAIHAESSTQWYNEMLLRNCILYPNANGGGEEDAQANLVVGIHSNEVYQNNCVSPTNEIADFYINGNITNQPLFVDRANFDLHLTPVSPCVNAGIYQAWMDGALDLDGNPRIDRAYEQVDMGCYEIPFVNGTSVTIR